MLSFCACLRAAEAKALHVVERHAKQATLPERANKHMHLCATTAQANSTLLCLFYLPAADVSHGCGRARLYEHACMTGPD